MVQAKTKIMTPKSPEWRRFCRLLEGKEGCNFHKDAKGQTRWKCNAGTSRPMARKILTKYFPEFSIPKSLAYFSKHGGYCDCEILFNVGS